MGALDTTGSSNPVRLSPAALEAAARNRQQAAAWITAQVSHAAIVSCDPVMCQALTTAGYPAGDLLTLGPSATDPMGSQIVVDTTVLRNQFGSKLPNVYAPVVIAGFGTGASRVDVRVEAPDGSGCLPVSQRADLLTRQQDGQQLLGNKDLHLAAAARQAIAAGDVDTRLLVTLVALMGQRYPIYVYRFGDVGPGATPGVPMRMMRIAALVQRGPARQQLPALGAAFPGLAAAAVPGQLSRCCTCPAPRPRSRSSSPRPARSGCSARRTAMTPRYLSTCRVPRGVRRSPEGEDMIASAVDREAD